MVFEKTDKNSGLTRQIEDVTRKQKDFISLSILSPTRERIIVQKNLYHQDSKCLFHTNDG